ncbi:MAG: ornithine cyclodeaminase family protein [Alphaproteobacteria bacterium]
MAIIISDDDVRKHLTMAECIEAMGICFGDFAQGKAKTLPRLRYRVDAPDDSGREYFSNVHVGAVPSYGMACVRAGSNMLVKGGAPGRKTMSSPDSTNWTVIILYDLNTAEPVAFMHESYMSGVRVGATTGVAVDKVARDDVTELGLLGTGRQARSNCEAICTARPSIKRVKVFSPTKENREAFPSQVQLEGVEIVPVGSADEVVVGADIVCSMTNSTTPTFDGNLLVPGQMVISVANSDVTLKRHEVDDTTFKRASDIIINDWESVVSNQQTELLDLIDSGTVDRDRIFELGMLCTGDATVKQTKDNIVYYKNNTGLGMQFAAAGAVVYNKMKGDDTNRVVPPEWLAAEEYA